MVLINPAGARAEHLWHGWGGLRDTIDENLRFELEELRCDSPCDEDDDWSMTDDRYAFQEMLRAVPEANDDVLCERYVAWSSACYAVLREPVIWSAVEAMARGLVERGKLNASEVVDLIGGRPSALVEARSRALAAWGQEELTSPPDAPRQRRRPGAL
jgi:hypothetical protein